MSALRTPKGSGDASSFHSPRGSESSARSHGTSSCGSHAFVVDRWRSNRRSTSGTSVATRSAVMRTAYLRVGRRGNSPYSVVTSMNGPVEISNLTARRFVLGKQGLWPGRRFAGKRGTADAIIACEHLQLDPLVILARSHDLMLHSRVVGYQPRFFDQLVYDERRFFDSGGWLAVRPMDELPYWRALMRREREQPRMRLIAEAHGDAIAAMRRVLRDQGTVANRDVEATDRRAIYGYRGAKETSLALYYLWRTGEAMTHHRNGFERVYAPADLVAPNHLLTDADDSDADRFVVCKEIAFYGIGRPSSYSRLLARRISAPESRAIEDELVESGAITGVAVEGWRGRHFVVTDDLDVLEEVARGRV